MADRTITARLRLVYNEFTKGTTAASQGLKGIGDQAKKTSGSVGKDWGAIGKSVSGLGDSLTTKVSLPLIGLGALATKAAGDFDAAFVQMQTLAGVSAGEVDGLKESVLSLAGETGKAPQELADAMFFLQSSGLDAASAMDALEISAKASAAGLGDTVTLADAASSVMLAYADSGMTAAQAMDTLIATAKAGKAEPEAIAGQLSKLIPISAALKISFQDVGGALAALSTKGFSAEQGATGLAAVMSKLQKPSQQAQESLDAVGLSGDRLKDLLGEKNLQGVLLTLKERLGDNGFIRFLEDQEAIRAGVALTSGDIKGMTEIFDQVGDSAGETDKAFATWAESMGAKNAKAFAQFQVALIRLGEVIAPIAADLMAFAADVVGKFAGLPEPVQKLVIAFGALLAAVGPLLSVGGRLVSAWSSTMKVFDNLTSTGGRAFADAMNAGTEATNNLATGMGRLRSGALNASIGIAALMAIGKAVDAIDPVGTANISKLENSLIEFGRSGHLGGEAASALGDDLDKLTDAMHRVAEPSVTERIGDITDHLTPGIEDSQHALKEARQTIEDFDEALATLAGRDPEAAAAAFDRVTEALKEQGIPAATTKEMLDQYATALAEADTANETAADGTESTTEAMADQEQQVNEAAAAFGAYADELKAAFDPAFGMVHALRENQDAFIALEDAQRNLNDVQKDGEATAADVAEAQRGVEEAMLGTEESALGVHVAASTLNAALAENPALIEDVKASLTAMREQGLIPNIETLGFLGGELDVATLKALGLGEVDPSVDVTETGSKQTQAEMRRTKDAATDIPSRRNTHLSTSGGAAAAQTIGHMIGLLGQVHDKNISITARAIFGPGIDLVQRLGGFGGGRASGGPVSSGRLYEVAEQGRAELLEMGGRQYLIPGSDGTVIPAGPMTSAAELGGGGGGQVIQLDMRGAIVTGGERQFRTMVQRAVNEAQRKGRGLNAA